MFSKETTNAVCSVMEAIFLHGLKGSNTNKVNRSHISFVRLKMVNVCIYLLGYKPCDLMNVGSNEIFSNFLPVINLFS